MKILPIRRRILVFAVRQRSKFYKKSGLYVPDSNRGMLTRAEDLWIAEVAKDCRGDWKQGQHVLVSDGFELDPNELSVIPMNGTFHETWQYYQDRPEFSFINNFSKECEGKIEAFIIHEDSILGEVLGDLIQEDVMW